MARRLVLSDAAVNDLEEIWGFISVDGTRRADDFIDQLYRKCLETAELDGVGRQREELFPGLWSIPFKKYVVFFQRPDGRLEIVRILHGSRDLYRVFHE